MRASRGIAEVWRLERASDRRGRLVRLCSLRAPDGPASGRAALIEDALWLESGARPRVGLCASAWFTLYDAASGEVLLSCCQADVIGKGVGRRVCSAGGTADGEVVVTGSNNGQLCAWCLSGVSSGRSFHHQPHRIGEFAPLSGVQPIGCMQPYYSAQSSSGRLVSMQIAGVSSAVESVRIWSTANPSSWDCICDLQPHGPGAVAEACASAQVVMCSVADGALGVWDAQSGTRRTTLMPEPEVGGDHRGGDGHGTGAHDGADAGGDRSAVETLLPSRCGRFVAAEFGGDGAVAVFETRRFERLCSTGPVPAGMELMTLGAR